jgi:hypothetical protein
LTDVPDIETSPWEIISFGYKIPPYQGLSQARIDANNMKK